MTLEEIVEEAAFVVQVARLRRALEGVKDWAARSGATGLEQWCSEALSPTGALAVFPPVVTADPKDARIVALEAERITLLEESTTLHARIWELEAEVARLTPKSPAVPQDPYPSED